MIKLGNIFITGVFVITIIWVLMVGTVAVLAATSINEQGARGLAHRIWCGKQTACQLPKFLDSKE